MSIVKRQLDEALEEHLLEVPLLGGEAVQRALDDRDLLAGRVLMQIPDIVRAHLRIRGVGPEEVSVRVGRGMREALEIQEAAVQAFDHLANLGLGSASLTPWSRSVHRNLAMGFESASQKEQSVGMQLWPAVPGARLIAVLHEGGPGSAWDLEGYRALSFHVPTTHEAEVLLDAAPAASTLTLRFLTEVPGADPRWPEGYELRLRDSDGTPWGRVARLPDPTEKHSTQWCLSAFQEHARAVGLEAEVTVWAEPKRTSLFMAAEGEEEEAQRQLGSFRLPVDPEAPPLIIERLQWTAERPLHTIQLRRPDGVPVSSFLAAAFSMEDETHPTWGGGAGARVEIFASKRARFRYRSSSRPKTPLGAASRTRGSSRSMVRASLSIGFWSRLVD